MPQPLDPVADEHGQVVGQVTSCALDTDGYSTGQAFVERKHTEGGTLLWVAHSLEHESRSEISNVKYQISKLEAITVVSRMLKRKTVSG